MKPAAEQLELTAEVRRLFQLAWPIAMGQLGMMAMGIVDTWMVGQVDASALAAIALGNAWSFSLLVVGIGTAVGTDPLVAQAWGARDDRARDRALARGLAVLGLICLPIMAGHLLCGEALRLLKQPAELIDLAQAYSTAVAPSTLPFVLFIFFRQALQSRGLSRPILWVVLLGNALNVVGNLLLMNGIGGWPGMGPVGSGWSTTLCRLAMLVAVLALCGPELAAIRRAWRDALNGPALLHVASTAVPVGLQIGLEVWAFNLCYPVIGWSGSMALAAHTIALTLAGVMFQIPLGLGNATASRVGNMVGAEQPWDRLGWTAVAIAAAYGLVSGSLLLMFGGAIAAAFLPGDPEAQALAASLLPFAAAFQIFDATQVVLFGVLRGVGDTRLPSFANLVGYYVIGLPLGTWLSQQAGMGAQGMWIGLVAGLASVSAILFLRLRWVQQRGATRLFA